MPDPKGDRLIVNLGASKVRRRLKGFGHGVRKVQTGGKDRAVIIHTATGQHIDELKRRFSDVGYWCREDDDHDEPNDAGSGRQTPKSFQVGDIVRDMDRLEWGQGIVVEDRTRPSSPTAGQRLTIDFERRGRVMVLTALRVLRIGANDEELDRTPKNP